MKKDVFFPPGVQVRLIERLGGHRAPEQLPARAAAKIEALWAERNRAPEAAVDAIDARMETIAVRAVLAAWLRQPL